MTLSPDALGRCRGQSVRPSSAPPKNVLTPLERAAVSAAAQGAATEQESLAPLFANLGAVASSGNLPPKLQQAIAQVLAQQTSLDQNLDGGDIKTPFRNPGFSSRRRWHRVRFRPSGVPDLKAALIVLRQTLQSAIGAMAGAFRRHRRLPKRRRSLPRRRPGLAPSLRDFDVQEIFLPQARLQSPPSSFRQPAPAAVRLRAALRCWAFGRCDA